MNYNLDLLNIAGLARIIKHDWQNINPVALPYLNAMFYFSKVNEDCLVFNTDGETVIRYFLSFAGSWRGELAKAVKAELKKRVGIKK